MTPNLNQLAELLSSIQAGTPTEANEACSKFFAASDTPGMTVIASVFVGDSKTLVCSLPGSFVVINTCGTYVKVRAINILEEIKSADCL